MSNCRICKKDLNSEEHMNNAGFCYLGLHFALDKITQAQKVLPELNIQWKPITKNVIEKKRKN